MTEEKSVYQESDSTKFKSSNIQFVGDRSAIVFSAEAGEPLPPVELPDDFFDLDKDDLRSLYKELKQNRDALENMAFCTKAVREMEESAATLSRLNRYSQTVIRVQFPDRLVLQAVFNHSDSIQTVSNFLRDFLDPTDVQFHLYTAPPKTILKPEMTLIDSKLTPRALVYFGVDSSQERTTFLKPSLMSSLVMPRLASEAALQYRRENVTDEVKEELLKPTVETSSSSFQKIDEPSTSKKSASSSTKVPKWFKR